jgi:hypothetical protein
VARRAALAGVLVALLLGALAACEDRPPIDIWGHKDSTSKSMSVGVPF